MSEQQREAVARAIWNVMREYEDRCDMELEDMGDKHHAWEMADAAMRALPADAAPSGWRTIESAPRNETDVLLYFGEGNPPQVGGWFRGEWLSAVHGCEFRNDPTHWMPLLAAPDA